MRSKNLRQRFTAFALATVMAAGVLPAIPVSATESDFVVQDEVLSVGAVNTAIAANLKIKESTGSGQETTSWTIQYGYGGSADNGVPEPVKEKDEDTKETKEYQYKVYVMVFEKGDRTKPVYGEFSTDEFGKKVISGGKTLSYVDPKDDPDHKNEFIIYASDLKSIGKKEIVAYTFDEYNYKKDDKATREAQKKAYNAAQINYAKHDGSQPTEPVESDYIKGVSKADYYVASAPLEIEVQGEARINTIVTSTSVQLDLYDDNADGYEIYRKTGKNYVKIATVASRTYTDKGLESNKTYEYRVRPYYYDKVTNKTSYGKYTTAEATTVGSPLNLKAKLNKSKNKVELTWTKVKGATKYEIYRSESTSTSSSVSKGDSNGFSTYKRIATVKKSKKKYTDKNVKTNRSYSYYVKTVVGKNKKVKKDKDRLIQEYVSVNISFSAPRIIKDYTNNKGDRTLEWNRVYGADGYLVEKWQDEYKPVPYNNDEEEYLFDGTYVYYLTTDNKKHESKYYVYKIENGAVYDCTNEEKKNADGETDYVPYQNKAPIESYKVNGNLVYQVKKDADRTEHIDGYLFYLDAAAGKVYEVKSNTGDIVYDTYGDWVEYKKLPAKTTTIKLPAEVYTTADKEVHNSTDYRIRAYKGDKYSNSLKYTVTSTSGVVSKVTAKKEANGIRVSWTPVPGAAYYKVYRIPTSAIVNNKDIGGYENEGTLVTEYVGAKEAVAVDVAAYNARYEADKAKKKADEKALNKEYTKAKKAGEKALRQATKDQHSAKNYQDAQYAYDKESDQKENQYDADLRKAQIAYNKAYDEADKNYNKVYAEAERNYNKAYAEVWKQYLTDREIAATNLAKAQSAPLKSYNAAYEKAERAYDKAYDEANQAYQKAAADGEKAYQEAYKVADDRYQADYKAVLDKFKAEDAASYNKYEVDKAAADKKYQEARESAIKSYQEAYKAADDRYQADYKAQSDAYIEACKPIDEAYSAAYKAANDRYQADYKVISDKYNKDLQDYYNGKRSDSPNYYDYDWPYISDYNYPEKADYNYPLESNYPLLLLDYSNKKYVQAMYDYPLQTDYYPVKSDYYPDIKEYGTDKINYNWPYKADYNYPCRQEYVPELEDYIPDVDDYYPDIDNYNIPKKEDYKIDIEYYDFPDKKDYLPKREDYYPNEADYFKDVKGSSAYYVKSPEQSDYYPLPQNYYPSGDDYEVDSHGYVTSKLEEGKSYHYQNYSYARSVFPADTTSILDYCGDLYKGKSEKYSDIRYKYDGRGSTNVIKSAEVKYAYNPIVNDDDVKESSIKAGVSYTYYVKAYMATPKTKADYSNLNKYNSGYVSDEFIMTNNTTIAAYNQIDTVASRAEYGVGKTYVDSDDFKDITGVTVGVKSVGTASFTTVKATGKPTLKSVKATKGKVTINIKKKVKGASYYKVYRSTKKKGKYTSVGVTKNAKTLKLVDKGATKGKTYYYKVVAVVKNEANGEVESKASAIKKVKAK